MAETRAKQRRQRARRIAAISKLMPGYDRDATPAMRFDRLHAAGAVTHLTWALPSKGARDDPYSEPN